MTSKNPYYFGIFAEKIAALLLIIKGYQILQRRYKTRFGEIDIIAKKSTKIIFVEVKARRAKLNIEEVLHPRQIERIKNAAEIFISKNHQFEKHDWSFDFIAVNKFFIPKHYCNFIS